jgi:hypothetical protein
MGDLMGDLVRFARFVQVSNWRIRGDFVNSRSASKVPNRARKRESAGLEN